MARSRLALALDALPLPAEVEYRPPGPGLQTHRIGVLLELLAHAAVVKPARPRDAAPVQVPRRHVWPVEPAPRHAPLVAQLRAPEVPAAPRVVRAGGALIDGAFLPRAKPGRRIKDPGYLAWLRQRDCSFCGPDQRTQTQAHHHGPRAVGRKTHDYFASPLCAVCHQLRVHHQGTLPGLTHEETVALLLSEQLRHLLLYFAALLGPDVDRWAQLGALAAGMSPTAAAHHFRLILDLLLQQLVLQQKGGTPSC